MNDLNIAWLAGLFEGEGSIENRPGKAFCINIGSTDEDVIMHVAAITEVGHLRHAQTLPSGRKFFVWRVSKAQDAISLLRKILPFLGARRTERALAMLEKFNAAPLPPRDSPNCKRGHPLVKRGRQRICHICERDKMRRIRKSKLYVIEKITEGELPSQFTAWQTERQT
jgi:hypothetical protein